MYPRQLHFKRQCLSNVFLVFIQVKDVRSILAVKTFVIKIKCVSESHPLKKCVPEKGKVGNQHSKDVRLNFLNLDILYTMYCIIFMSLFIEFSNSFSELQLGL